MRWLFSLSVLPLIWASNSFAADAAGAWKGFIETKEKKCDRPQFADRMHHNIECEFGGEDI